MNNQENISQQLQTRDYAIVIRRNAEGYSACVPDLGIVVSAPSTDACYALIEEKKSAIFKVAVESGFGDALLSGPNQSRPRQNVLRMFFVLLVVSILLLTVLIPTTYVMSRVERLVPAFAETAMDVVQRRIKTMSDEDQRKLSMLATQICPVINDMVEARCRSAHLPGTEKSGGKNR